MKSIWEFMPVKSTVDAILAETVGREIWNSWKKYLCRVHRFGKSFLIVCQGK